MHTKPSLAIVAVAAVSIAFAAVPVALSTSTPPPVVALDPARENRALAALKVAPAVNADTYRRAAFGTGWADEDQDGCSTRDEVLMRDLTGEKFAPKSRCRVLSGNFRDPYTGISGQAEAGALDIDHVSSLADAWRSGAHAWPEPRRVRYANDMRNLLATNDTANRCKSDKGPAEWSLPVQVGGRVCDRQRAPLDPKLRCAYAARYVSAKARWRLAVTEQDRQALQGMLDPCSR